VREVTFRGAEVAVSSTSGEGGSIDLHILDSAGLFLIVEVKVKQEELDKAVGQLRSTGGCMSKRFISRPSASG
jgi:hypothetical protein